MPWEMGMKDNPVIWGVIGLVVVIGIVVRWWWAGYRRRLRQRRWMRERLGDDQRALLVKKVPWFSRLPSGVRENLEGLMCAFLQEKRFEACGGLEEVTMKMKLVIAAHACLLIAGRKDEVYPELWSVLVYPGAFTVPDDGEGTMDEDGEIRLGESWDSGSVVLSWDTASGAREAEPGEGLLNVLFHEFAHQLDQANGISEGVPALACGEDYKEWSRVFKSAYDRLVREVESGRSHVIDEYGAEEPAEFFAVVTETFFERPRALARWNGELFEQMRKFYQLDPREWQRG